MRLKYYLRGLGLGILVSTVFLMISIQLHGGIMTDDRVVARAKELGMVVPDTKEEDPKETEATESQLPENSQTAEPVSETTEAAPDENLQNDATQEAAGQDDTAQDGEDTPQQEPASQDSATEDEAVIFTVADGEVCRTAAEKLVACGLIADVDSFRQYMKERDYDGLIREGTYRIPADADMDLIARIITAQVPEAVVEDAPDSSEQNP